MKNLKIILSIFLILIVTLVCFFPALKNNFTNWDDNLYVTENTAIQFSSLTNLKNISTSFFITHYHPATIFSYLLEYRFFKLNPFNYHLTNLILHLLNCLLVFWVIYLISGRVSVACLTALFFGIHPMQVESVAWISERKNVLYAFFFLGAMVSYLYYLRKERALKYYLLCLGLFILALLSKSMAITLPLVLLVLDYFTSRKINPAVFIEKIPYFFLSLLFGLIALLGGYSSKTACAISAYDLFTRLKGVSRDIIFYLNKLCFPARLSALYPYTEIKNNPFYLYSLIMVIILLAGVIISKRYTKKVILGSGLFLMMVFPAIRYLPLVEIIAADRYIYLASIGIFYLFAEGFIWLYLRRTGYYRFIRIFLVSGLIAVVMFLSFFTWERSQVWKDSLSLWNDVLEKYPDTAIAYSKRGEFLLSKGEYYRAYADFKDAIRLGYGTRHVYKNREYYSMDVLNAATNLANVYNALDKKEEAINTLKTVIGLNPNYEIAYCNLASIYSSMGDNNSAIALYKKALEIFPYYATAYNNLGFVYVAQHDQEKAISMFNRAIEIDPTCNSAYIKLAGIYKVLGQEEKLRLLYKKAIANNLDFFSAYYYFGNLSADAQKDKEAILLYSRAIAINPGSKEACVGLGNSYLTIGRNKEAITWLKKALKLDSNLAVAHNNLALAYYYTQEYDLAIKHCDQAIKLGYKIAPKLLGLLKPHRK